MPTYCAGCEERVWFYVFEFRPWTKETLVLSFHRRCKWSYTEGMNKQAQILTAPLEPSR